MAITLVSALYPPMFSSTFAPAFVNTTSPTIYFSISPYNSAADITRVHISLVNQETNENALTDATGIYISEGLQYDTEIGMYYVVIPVDHVKNGLSTGWNYNQFYKLQLRFDSNPNSATNNSDYFISNLQYFSEWSEIMLLRPILQPQILLRTFDTNDGVASTLTFNKGIIPISGQVYFGDNNATDETETLQSYWFEILLSISDTVMLTTETIYTGNNINQNTIAYNLDLAGLDTSDTSNFRLRVHITTKNNYTMTKDYSFSIAEYVTEDTFDPDVTIDLDNENGIATLHIANVNAVFGTLHVRRSSSISNFKEWENIYEYPVAGEIDLDIVDNTIGSGIWYRYYCQLENSTGAMTPMYYSSKIFPDFYNAILSRGNKQFATIFNYTISNYKPVVNRQKMDTLGGKYPKFAENAAMNYRQFSISGLISTQEDEDNLFLDKEEYFGDEYNNYRVYEEQEYRDNYYIENYNWFWERGFREKLIDWLNDGEPKLYRSQTEGLMCVMLTDISLTPNATLGRRLYTFTATVYEVADGNSLATLDSLGIYKVTTPNSVISGGGGGDEPTPEYVEVDKPGQIYSETVNEMVSGKVDVVANTIMARLKERYGGVQENKNPTEGYLKNVKIFFQSKPHMFIQTAGGLQLVTDISQYSAADRQRIQLGYSFEVNNQGSNPSDTTVFFVNQKGYYQIPTNIDVTSLFFPQTDDIVTVEYVLHYKEMNDTSTIISGTTVEKTLVGQERGVFQANEYVGERIRKKYSYVVPGSFYQQMQWWRGICLDVTPYAVAHIQYYRDTDYNDYEIGGTGVLHMIKDASVQDMCFIGRRMRIVDKERQNYLQGWECVVDEGTYTSQAAIKHPKYNTVYTIGDTRYIYYINGQWYTVSQYDSQLETLLAAVPVEGLISYYGDVIRNSYQ